MLPASQGIRIVLYNIQYAIRRLRRWTDQLTVWKHLFPDREVIEDIAVFLQELSPDIAGIVEIDTGSFRTRNEDQSAFLSASLGMSACLNPVKYGGSGLSQLLRHLPIFRRQANALMTRLPLEHGWEHMLSAGTKRTVIHASLLCPKPVHVLLCHLSLRYGKRCQQLEELSRIVQAIREPVILAGDLNIFRGPEELRRFLSATGLSSDHAPTGDRHTYPSWRPERSLDYILVSEEIRVLEYRIVNCDYSDHLPVVMDFEVG